MTGVPILKDYFPHYHRLNADSLSCIVGGTTQVTRPLIIKSLIMTLKLILTFAPFSVPAIRKYGALNGLSTETYETLHKTYVKNPYRASNRKHVMKQLVNAVS